MPETALLSASQNLFYVQNSLPRTGTTSPPGLYIPSGTTVLNHNARPAQISPAINIPAAQRSAVRCCVTPFVMRIVSILFL